MSQRDRIAEIEDFTVKEFKTELKNAADSLQKGIKPGNAIELLGAALQISKMGEDLKMTLEKWLQIDLWEETK